MGVQRIRVRERATGKVNVPAGMGGKPLYARKGIQNKGEKGEGGVKTRKFFFRGSQRPLRASYSRDNYLKRRHDE